MTKDLRKLVEIAEVIRDRDLAELAATKAYNADLQKRRDSLVKKADHEQQIALSDLVYRRVLFDARATGLHAEILDITRQQATSAAKLEATNLRASKSFGRASTLSRLLQSLPTKNR